MTAVAVDNTPSVLGVDASQCIAIDMGGGDSISCQGAIDVTMTGTCADAAWLGVVLRAFDSIVK